MLVLLVRYTVILCAITPVCYCVSIRRAIESAKQYLKSNGIPDLDMCTPERISALCANSSREVVCSVRLVKNKVEFKQFDNMCYMDLNNICESQDNIWAIKNFAPCIMNPDLRRYANAIEDTDFQDDLTYDDYGEKVIRTTTEKNEPTEATEATTKDTEVYNTMFTSSQVDNDTTTTSTNSQGDNDTTTISTSSQGDNDAIKDENAHESTSNPVVDETEPIKYPAVAGDETPLKMPNGDYLNFGSDEIGKIFDEDTGTVKSILRQASRFPPLRANYSFGSPGAPCKDRVRPCPAIYLPMCLHYEREKPNLVQYYYFVNRCEAEQWTCYHPERKVDKASSMRTSFCGHSKYLMYSRFMHSVSAFMHYGWLHGPGRFNHMLQPHERA